MTSSAFIPCPSCLVAFVVVVVFLKRGGGGKKISFILYYLHYISVPQGKSSHDYNILDRSGVDSLYSKCVPFNILTIFLLFVSNSLSSPRHIGHANWLLTDFLQQPCEVQCSSSAGCWMLSSLLSHHSFILCCSFFFIMQELTYFASLFFQIWRKEFSKVAHPGSFPGTKQEFYSSPCTHSLRVS